MPSSALLISTTHERVLAGPYVQVEAAFELPGRCMAHADNTVAACGDLVIGQIRRRPFTCRVSRLPAECSAGTWCSPDLTHSDRRKLGEPKIVA